MRKSISGAEVERSYIFCHLRLKSFLRCSKFTPRDSLDLHGILVSPDDVDDVDVILEQI